MTNVPSRCANGDWRQMRLKYVAPLRNERLSGGADHRGYLGLENIESWTGRIIEPTTANREEEEGGTVNVFREGDVLFGKLRPYLAKACNARQQGVCSTELLVMRPVEEADSRFLLYTMLAPAFVEAVNSSTFGAKMPRADWDFIGSLKIQLPSLRTQESIVSYLDRETTRIDRIVAEKQRMLALLEEKCRAAAALAVTRGLRRDVRTKSSGQQWLGEIPTDWTVERAKNLFSVRDERSDEGLEELLTVSHITGVTSRAEKEVYMFEAENKSGYKRCMIGDLAINTLWAWMGAMGVSPVNGIVSPDYHVYTPKGQLDPEYIDLLCRSRPFVAEVSRWSKGVWSSRLRLYPENFFEMRLPVPPHNEQLEIVHAIKDNQRKADNLSNALRQSIDLAKQRRIALTAAAVSGQISTEEMVR